MEREQEMKKSYRYLFFDLDGTLTDSGEGITNAVEYTLNKFGIPVTDRSILYRFIGPPLKDSLMKYYDFSEEDAKRGVVYYREYYAKRGILENKVYEGLTEQLKSLRDRGKELVVATSKPEAFAKRILEHFQIDSYFSCIAGATMDESRVHKDEVIAYALEQCQISEQEKEAVLMIGDREHDVFGAKKNGIDVMGVLYGFGSREELEAAGADYIVEQVEEIGKIR